MFFNFVIIFKFVIFRDPFIEFFPTESNPVKNIDYYNFYNDQRCKSFWRELKIFSFKFLKLWKNSLPRITTESTEIIHVRETKEALHHLIVRVYMLGLGSVTLVAAVLTISWSTKRLLTSEHIVLYTKSSEKYLVELIGKRQQY